jgi:hypothetical protein
MGHGFDAAYDWTAVVLTPAAVRRLESVPGLAQVLACNSLVHQSIAREWMINIGHRTSFERLQATHRPRLRIAATGVRFRPGIPLPVEYGRNQRLMLCHGPCGTAFAARSLHKPTGERHGSQIQSEKTVAQ